MKLHDFLMTHKIHFITEKEECLAYSVDAFHYEKSPNLVIIPATLEELELIVTFCFEHQIKFLLRAGGTSYTGASVVFSDEVIILTQSLNSIQSFDKIRRLCVVEPGVRTLDVRKYMEDYGHTYFPDPASSSICTIGGNVATNAGGPHCFKYGVTSNYIRKIDGSFGKQKRAYGSISKYALTYSAVDLLVGSEGTLSTAYKISLLSKPNPPKTRTFVLDFPHYAKAINFMEDIIGSGVHPAVIDMSTKPIFPENSEIRDATIFLVLNGGDQSVNYESEFVQKLVQKHEGMVSYDIGKAELSIVRKESVFKNVQEVIEKTGKPQYFLFDAVVPREYMTPILDYIYNLAKAMKFPLMNTFHLGDGNIHPTIFYNPKEDIESLNLFWYGVSARVLSLGGSLSGEHGIGIEKKNMLMSTISDLKHNLFMGIKSFFDPHGLMSPGKLLASQSEARTELQSVMERFHQNYPNYTSVQNNSVHITHQSGFTCCSAQSSITEINISLDQQNQAVRVPYLPIIGTSWPIEYHIKNNTPNLLGHYWELDEILLGATLQTPENEFLDIGSWTLKNVTGYSLNLLLYVPEYNLKQIRLKLAPFSKNIQRYSYLFVDEILNNNLLLDISKLIISYYHFHTKEIKGTLLVYFYDTETENAIRASLQHQSIQEIDSPNNFVSSNEQGYLISLGGNDPNHFLNYLNLEEEYIYSSHQNYCFVTKEFKSRMHTLLTDTRHMKHIESIRHFSKTESRNIYQNDDLKQDAVLADELSQNLTKIISCYKK